MVQGTDMKPKTFVLLVVAAGCGLVAMLGVQQAMSGQRRPVKAPTTKVLVALENLDTGVRLTKENTTFKEMPISLVHEDAVRSEKEFDQRAARVPMVAGDLVRKSKLTEPGDWGKSISIPKGMRVIGIPVDDTHTISGLLRPGDRVDVLVTYQGPGERGKQISKTKTLLEHVEVFNTDNLTANKIEEKTNTTRAKNIGLLVTPEQAGFVILAQRKGSLSLSWRRKGDDELAQTKDIDEKLMEELQGTVGIHDGSMSLNRDDFPVDDPDASAVPTASQFLDEVASQSPAPVVAPPAVPMWTVTVYSGNNTLPHQFEMTPTGGAANPKQTAGVREIPATPPVVQPAPAAPLTTPPVSEPSLQDTL